MPTIDLICVSLCAYLALHELWVYRATEGDRGSRWGAMLCAIVALYSIVRFTQRVAPDAAVAVTWTRVQFAVGVFMAPASIGTLREFGGRPEPRSVISIATAAAAVYAVVILSTDLFFSGEARLTVDALGASQLVAIPGPGMVLLAVLVVPSIGLAAWQVAVGDLQGNVRIVGATVVVVFAVAAANDALFRAARIQSVQFLEVGLTAIAVAVGYVSINRFRERRSETTAALAKTEEHRSQLHETTRSLAHSEARLREFADASREGIALFEGRRIVDVNAPLFEMTGRPREHWLGRDVGELAATESQASLIVQAAADPHASRIELQLVGPSAVTYEMTRHAGESGIGSLAFRDVTHRKVEEHGLVLAERIATYSTLAAATAHEVNNPLAAVMANLDLLDHELSRPRPDPALVSELLHDATHGAERIRAIAADLRGIGKTAAAGTGKTCTVEAALDSALRLTRNLTRYNIAMTRRGPERLVVFGDEGKLTQVLVNLVTNAVHALDGTGEPRIEITVRTEDHTAFIEVADNGPGVPDDLRARIFEPMFSTKASRGSGLGLAVSRDLVRGMDGELTLLADRGVGCVFQVSLTVSSTQDGEVLETPDLPVLQWGDGDHKSILVVDDEPFLAKCTARALAPYHVVAVESVGAALDAIASTTFDAVVSDLMMPGRSGIDLHEALRDMKHPLAERILFVSGGVFGPSMADALAASVRPVLPKPWSINQLRAAVLGLLGAPRNESVVVDAGPEGDPAGGVRVVVRALLASARELADADRWSVVVADELGRVATRSIFCEGSDGIDQPVPASANVRAVLRTRVPVSNPHLEPYDTGSRDLYALGIRSTVIVPISMGDAAIATLNGGSTRPDAFAPETITILASLCARYGPVLDRARRHWLERRSGQSTSRIEIGSHYLLRPEAMLQEVSDAIVVTDVSGRIAWTNRSATTLLGRNIASLEDTTLAGLVAPAHRSRLVPGQVRGEGRKTLSLSAAGGDTEIEATHRPIDEDGLWLGTQWTLRRSPSTDET